MSLKYSIRYLKTAESDLYEIFDYIKRDNPSAASALLEKIDEAINRLATNPYLGRTSKDIRLKNKGYRMLVIEKYLVFYIVKSKTIQIRRILHGARKYSFLL